MSELKCSHCGEHSESTRKAYINGSLVDVCLECIDKDFKLCEECGEFYLTSELQMIDDDTYVCEDCFQEHYRTCAECGALERISNMKYANDIEAWICIDCYHESFETCEWCGNIYRRSTMTATAEGYVCIPCRDVYYSRCDSCGEWFRNDEMYRQDEYDYCRSCWEERGMDEILDYHGNDGEWTEYRLPGESIDVMLTGHELEVEPQGYDYDLHDAIRGAKDNLNCYLEHDGSLNSDGFEIVSQPQSYEYVMAHYEDYKRAFEQILEAGYVSHNSDNCGLHFHFTAPYERGTDERETVLSRLWLIVETYKELFEKISRRHGDFQWCEFLSRNNDNSMLNGIYKMKKVYKDDTRYLVINNENSKTIELRLFKGTLNIDTFFADYQFAYNLFKLAYDLDLDITEIDWAKLTEGKYISKYCQEHNFYTDKKITDDSIKYITLENKAMRLIKNIYNEYNRGLKKMMKNLSFPTKNIDYDYNEMISNKFAHIRTALSSLANMQGDINKKNISNCMYRITDLFYNCGFLNLEVDTEKMTAKFDKIKEYYNEL